MGYDRNERRTGHTGDRGYGAYDNADRVRAFGRPDRWEDDRPRPYAAYAGSRDYRGDRFNDRPDDDNRYSGGYGSQDRGFFDRAGDEVRSWFGDEEAERRRLMDERYDRDSDRGFATQGQVRRSRHDHDPHYRTWRDRQLETLDNDYDEYRREHQSKFDTEFGSWRQSRQGQRDQLTRVTEHQEVVGSDGEHVGTVDHVRGDHILLTKSDVDAGGRHHSIPSSWIVSVDDKVKVAKTADQAKAHWRDEQRNEDGGLFGRDEDRNRNPSRSFSGTF
jgi:hypothetical protein